MRFAVGDAVGQVKVITCARGINTTLPQSPRPQIESYFAPDRTAAVEGLRVVTFRGYKDLVAVASKGGLIRIFDPSKSPISPSIAFTHRIADATPTDSIVAFSSQDDLLCAAVESGAAVFVNLRHGSTTPATFPAPISAFAISEKLEDSLPTVVAVTGKDREIELLERFNGTWKSVWKSKNVKPNAMKLAVPMWVTCITFLAAPSSTAENKCHRFLTADRYGQLRLYDTSCSRRPMYTADLGRETGIAKLALHPGSPIPPADIPLAQKNVPPERSQISADLWVVYSDNSGYFGVYSLLGRRSVGIFKGFSGAVLGIGIEQAAGLVAGVGFDRYLRVYDGDSREPLAVVYTKTTGTAVAVLDEKDPEVVYPDKQKEKEQEEDVWDEMEEVSDDADVGEGSEEEEEDEEAEDESEGDMTEALVEIKRKKDSGGGEGRDQKKRRRAR